MRDLNGLPDAFDGQPIATSGNAVQVTNLAPGFVSYLVGLAQWHKHMFDLPLIITSGNDGEHAADSLHYHDRAVDIRVSDLPPQLADRFAARIAGGGSLDKVGLYDERLHPGGPHFHIDYWGE